MHALGEDHPEFPVRDAEAVWLPPSIPPREVRRRRLHGMIQEGLRRPLTVIVAPAGMGKTRLAACFADTERRAGRHVDWLSADQHVDLGAALLGLREQPMPRRDRRGRIGRADVTDRLKATVSGSVSAPQVVMVDDAHLLQRPELELLCDALTRCPTAIRVLLLGRRNPLPISLQLALGDAMTVVRGRQLVFDATEARQLVLVHAPGSADDDIAKVVKTCQGWAAPLVMGARALASSQGQLDHGFRLEYVEQAFLDHLLSDCFETMSETLHHILLACCQEDDVDAESALALSGVADALRHLSTLAGDGLVTSTVDSSRPGGLLWRLHPLLKEALRRVTSPTTHDWPLIVEAHTRAARHYAADEDAVRALRHAHRSGDGPTVIDMLVRYGALLVPSEAAAEVAAGLLCLPDPVKAAAPHLVALEALLHRAEGRVDVALAKAQQACDAASPADQVTASEAASVVSVRLWRSTLGWGHMQAAIDDARRLLGCSDSNAGHAHPTGELSLAQSACVMVELAAAQTWSGDLRSAAVHLQEAERAADLLVWSPLLASALAHRCVLELAAGTYRTAADTARGALAADPTGALPPDVRARAHLTLGWAATYGLNPRAARTTLKNFDGRARPADPLVRAVLDLLRCRVLNQDGEGDQALRLLAASKVLDGAPRFLWRLAAVIEAETAARSQALGELEGAAQRLRTLGFDEEAELFECLAPQTPAAASAALVRLDALLARPDLHPATGAGAAAVRMISVLQLAPERARELLPDLLSRVHPQRLLVFLDVVTRVTPEFLYLLMQDVETGPSHPAVPEALAVLGRTHKLPASDPFMQAASTTTNTSELGTDPATRITAVAEEDTVTASTPEPVIVLTQRQADVLAQLASGGSYTDIARNLYVTENTVKTHLISLYRKLEVNRRSDALRRARELGLL